MLFMVVRNLASFEDFESLKRLSFHGPVFLLKHSLTLPGSVRALDVFSEFAGSNTDVPCFLLKVQEARNVSDRVAVDCGVGHESPQVLLFVDGVVVWSASHNMISGGSLANALGEALKDKS